MKKSTKIIVFVTALIVLIAAVYAVISIRYYRNDDFFRNEYEWYAPSFVTRYADKTAVISDGGTLISILDADMNCDAIIPAGIDFSKADYVAMNSEGIFVADIVNASNSNRVASEELIQFDFSGNYVRSLMYKEYTPGKNTMPAQKGYLCWLGEYDGKIWLLYNNRYSIEVSTVVGDEVKLVRSIPAESAPPIWNITYSAKSDTIWIAGKNGNIYRENDAKDGFEVYDNGLIYSEGNIYLDIFAYGDRVYAADLGLCKVIDIITGQEYISPDDEMMIYRVCGDEKGVTITDQVSVILADESGITYNSPTVLFSSGYKTACMWGTIAEIYIIICIAAVLIFIVVATFRSSHSRYTRIGVLVAVTIVISSMLISNTVLSDTLVRLSSSTYDSLKSTAETVSYSSRMNGIGEALKDVNELSDYGNESYNYIRETLDVYCDSTYNVGGNMYYIVFKFDDSMLYGVMDYENTIGTIYPYQFLDPDSYYTSVVKTGEIHLEEMSEDVYGAWSYACAPLYDYDGVIVGAVEFGVNMRSQTQANDELINSIVMRVAIIILLIILALVEGTSFVEGLHGFRKEKDPNIPYFLRPMMFLTFLGSNLSAAFIPQLSMKVYTLAGLHIFDDNLASALPMSLQLLGTAVSALVCGKLLERFNMKTLMIFSGCVQVLGYLMIGFSVLSSNYIVFSAGHLVTGLGIGFIVVSLNALPDQVDDEDRRNGFYTSLNAGVISGVVFGGSVGTYLCEMYNGLAGSETVRAEEVEGITNDIRMIGYAGTFFTSIVFVIVVIVLTLLSVGKGRHAKPEAEEEQTGVRLSGIRFIFRKEVFFFIVCVMMPMLIMLYFKDYLYPMYASDIGVADTDIGNIILISGTVSIVFGTTISEFLMKHLGNQGVLAVSAIVTCGSLVLFGLIPTYMTAVIAVFILSLVAGFGLGAQEIYFSSLNSFKEYGAKRSMSIYSIFDNISQTAGPLFMGAMLFLGYGGECYTIGITGIALYLIFAAVKFIGGLKSRKKVKGND